MSMCSPSALEPILLSIAPVFNSPSAANFSVLVYGWILAGCRWAGRNSVGQSISVRRMESTGQGERYEQAEWQAA
jgi:hypothetical protein